MTTVIDTGYEGFVAVSEDIFHSLALDELYQHTRTVVLANGIPLTSNGTYATIWMLEPDIKLDGFVETHPGLHEILVGTEALKTLKITLDYCAKRMKVGKCI